MNVNSETPVSAGVVADDEVRHWCMWCKQNTWSLPLPYKVVSLKTWERKTRTVALSQFECQRCGKVTD